MLIIPAIQAVKTRSRASCGSPSFVVTSVSPTRIGNQDIFSPSNSSTARRVRNANPFDAQINGNLTKNSDPTTFFSHVVGVKAVPEEVANVDASKMMNFASNPVLGEIPKFMNLRLSTAHTANKLKSIISPATRVQRLTNNSDRLASRHRIAEVTADRVSEAKVFSDYIKNSEFENMKFFEFENNSGTRLDQMTRPDQDISQINPESRINPNSRINPESRVIPNSRINLDSRINCPIRIKSPIRPTFNIPLTLPTDIEEITRPTDSELLTRPTNFELLTQPMEFSEKKNIHRQICHRHLHQTPERRKRKVRRRKSNVSIGKMTHQTRL